MVNNEMVFSLNDVENNKIIRAIVRGMKPGLAHMLLMRLGITNNYDQSKEMIDKALSAK